MSEKTEYFHCSPHRTDNEKSSYKLSQEQEKAEITISILNSFLSLKLLQKVMNIKKRKKQ